MLHNNAALTPRLAVFILIGASLLFVLIAAAVSTEVFAQLDNDVLIFLRNAENLAQPRGPAWLEHFTQELTALGGWPLLTMLSVTLTVFFVLRGQWDFAIILPAVALGEMVMVSQMKLAFARLRPDAVPHLVEATSNSFPSGHAASAAAIYLTLGLMLANISTSKSMRLYAFITPVTLAVMIGLSRIYLGVHYPSDVFAGWCVGAAWASLIWIAAWKLTAPPSSNR